MKKILLLLSIFISFVAGAQPMHNVSGQSPATYNPATGKIGVDTTILSSKWYSKHYTDSAIAAAATNELYNQNWVDSATGNDATAVPGNANFPYFHIDSAIAHLPLINGQHGGTIFIGLGSYNAPTDTANFPNTAGLRLQGSGMPQPNWVVSITAIVATFRTPPTALIGGTIINGTLFFIRKNNITIDNMGFDDGSAWIAAHNSGVPVDGLDFAQALGTCSIDGTHACQTASPPTFGCSVTNISTLQSTPTATTHGFLFENIIYGYANNIHSYYGEHGIIFKAINTQASNLWALGCAEEGVIIKSDDYANCWSDNFTNIYVSSLGTHDGGGVELMNESSFSLWQITLTNVVVENTVNFGVKFLAIGSYSIDRCTGANWTIQGVQGKGVVDSGGLVNNSQFSNLNINGCTSVGLYFYGGTFNSFSDVASYSNVGGLYVGDTYSMKLSNISTYANTGTDITFLTHIWSNGIFQQNSTSLSGTPESGWLTQASSSGGSPVQNFYANNVLVASQTNNVFKRNNILNSIGAPEIIVHAADSSFQQITAANLATLLGVSGTTLQQAITNGGTLNTANSITNTGQTLTWNGGFYKYNGTLSTVGTPTVMMKGQDSTLQQAVVGAGLSVASGTLNTIGALYTPTLTNTTNISASTLGEAIYTRSGGVVYVSIGGSLTPTLISTSSVLTVSLPITSTSVGSQGSLGSGVIVGTGGNVIGIIAVPTASTATLTFFSPLTTSTPFNMQFSYGL